MNLFSKALLYPALAVLSWGQMACNNDQKLKNAAKPLLIKAIDSQIQTDNGIIERGQETLDPAMPHDSFIQLVTTQSAAQRELNDLEIALLNAKHGAFTLKTTDDFYQASVPLNTQNSSTYDIRQYTVQFPKSLLDSLASQQSN